MIAKKNSRYDLKRKRIVLFPMGLLIAGSFTLAAFTYKTDVEAEQEKKIVAAERVMFQTDDFSERPKDEPLVKTKVTKSERQETTLDAKANPDENTVAASNSNDIPKPDVGHDGLGYKFDDDFVIGGGEDLKGEEIDIVDIEAQYVGGAIEMQRFISKNTKYPQDAIELGEQGIVYISFVVELDGSVSNIRIEREVFGSIDREAKRIVRSFPKWIPGELNYAKVRTRVRLPIKFILED